MVLMLLRIGNTQSVNQNGSEDPHLSRILAPLCPGDKNSNLKISKIGKPLLISISHSHLSFILKAQLSTA